MDLTLPVRVTLGPWWPSGRSIDSELVCRLVMLWQLSVSLLPADELHTGHGRALDGKERPEAGLEAGESVHRSGVLPYSGLLPPLRPPRLPVPEEGESRLACLASVPWGLPRIEGHLPESGVPGELALLLALVPNNLGGVERRVQSFRNARTDNYEQSARSLLDDETLRFGEGKADDTEIIPHETLVTTSREVWISVAQRESCYKHPYKSFS